MGGFLPDHPLKGLVLLSLFMGLALIVKVLQTQPHGLHGGFEAKLVYVTPYGGKKMEDRLTKSHS